MNEPMRRVDPEIYDRDYFESTDGAQYFAEREIAPKFNYAVSLGEVDAQHRVLDIGCGRGDLMRALSLTGARVVGLDYSQTSAQMTAESLSDLPDTQVAVLSADATAPPFADQSFDRIFMIDIVEHLYPEQLQASFAECHRLLKPGGLLVAHTSPNRWYNDIGYPYWELPWNKFLNAAFKQNLLTRPIRTEMDHQVHVNEQTLPEFESTLTEANFRVKAWFGSEYVRPVKKDSPAVQFLELARQGLCHLYPLSLIAPLNRIFSNNLWAVARK